MAIDKLTVDLMFADAIAIGLFKLRFCNSIKYHFQINQTNSRSPAKGATTFSTMTLSVTTFSKTISKSRHSA